MLILFFNSEGIFGFWTLEVVFNVFRIGKELQRYNKFRLTVLGVSEPEKIKQQEIESKNYAKYILRKGSVAEKRDLLSCLKSKLIFKDKKLELAS